VQQPKGRSRPDRLRSDPAPTLRSSWPATSAHSPIDPLKHSLYAFPWGSGPLEGHPARGRWQGDVKVTIRDHLANPETRFQPLRIAIASGHGIGKSAEIGMLSKWALDCWVDSRVVITANTEQQLITKTSPEVNKWHKLAITRDWFKPATMKISSKEAGHEDSWRLDFVTWSANNTEAFAGLHNVGRLILVMMDEGSNIDDKVWEVTEGALTDENTSPHLDRVRQSDPQCRHGSTSASTATATLDHPAHRQPRRSRAPTSVSAGPDRDLRDRQRHRQGARARPVPVGFSLQFIGTGMVTAAREREIVESAILPSDPVIFGLDHARFGDDTSQCWRYDRAVMLVHVRGSVERRNFNGDCLGRQRSHASAHARRRVHRCWWTQRRRRDRSPPTTEPRI
jgi:hypothetical protein